jgi:uncharacterized RDD family membrane protein YckC
MADLKVLWKEIWMANKIDEVVFVGFWKRISAGLIDCAVFLPVILVWIIFRHRVVAWEVANGNIIPGLIWYIVSTIFGLWLVVRFGGSPGKLILGIRIVDVQGKYLSWTKAFRRWIFPALITGVNNALMRWKAFSTYPDSTPHSTSLEIKNLINEYGQPFAAIGIYLGGLALVDIIVIVLNRKKRAIHDFVAGSYVISKESYKALAEPEIEGDGQNPAVDLSVRLKDKIELPPLPTIGNV